MSVRTMALAALVLTLGLVFSGAASAVSRDRTPPTTPTNLRITATGPTSISLAWNASTDNSGKFWYIVQGCGGTIRVDPPQTTFTNSRLAPNRTLSCSVYAVDAAGNRSATSNTVSYTTPPDTTPPSPAPTLTATNVVPTRVSVNWTAAVDNTSQVWYTLFVNGATHGSDMIGSLGATLLRLSPATTYVFKVTARDAYFNVAESNVVSVTTPAVTDTVPPTAPTNLRLSSESMAPEAWLDWDQSTDNSDPQSQILYDVYLNGVRNDDGIIGYGSTITYCRAPGPTTIVLRAVDTSGNVSAPSNEIHLQLLSRRCLAPAAKKGAWLRQCDYRRRFRGWYWRSQARLRRARHRLSAQQDLGEQRRLHVAARHDRQHRAVHAHPAGEERGEAGRAGGLGDDVLVRCQEPHRLAQMVVADEHDVVDECLHERHSRAPGHRRREPVCDRRDRLEHDRLAARIQRTSQRRRALRLDADHAGRTAGRVQRRRDSREQGIAPDRHEHRRGLGRVLRDLGSDRGLPLDHDRILERVHERGAALGDRACRARERHRAASDRTAAPVRRTRARPPS